jgi:hypothetical protein
LFKTSFKALVIGFGFFSNTKGSDLSINLLKKVKILRVAKSLVAIRGLAAKVTCLISKALL